MFKIYDQKAILEKINKIMNPTTMQADLSVSAENDLYFVFCPKIKSIIQDRRIIRKTSISEVSPMINDFVMVNE